MSHVGSETPAESTQMLTALVRLRSALQHVVLPLELPNVAERRATRSEMVDQLEDYVIPRVMTLDAPLLAVVGGSTGAGKSTLVNSLVGTRVTEPGVLRPTTRSPVLVHNPADAGWFGQDRLLPDLERVHRTTSDPGALQLVPNTTVPEGLAILDAPDVDSVEESNRALAAQLLAAADLWIFVTSAARYADQVPWDFLRKAADRSAAVAIVLDRTPPEAVDTVAAHLARMLASRGLKDSPLFTVIEGEVDENGLLPAEAVGRDQQVADRARRRLRGACGRRQADPGGRDPHPHPPYARGRRRRDRAGRRRGTAARGRQPRLRQGRPRHRRRDRGRHPPPRRGAGAVAGVRRDGRAAAGSRDQGGLAARPGRQRDQGQAAAGRAGHRRRRVRPRDADPRARRGGRRACRGVLAVPRAGAGAAGRRRRGPRPRLPRPAPQDRACGPRLAAGRAGDGPHRGRRQARHGAVPGLRRQRPVGGADGRRVLPHRGADRCRGRHRRRVGRAGAEAARGGLRRPGRPRAWPSGPGASLTLRVRELVDAERARYVDLLDSLALDGQTPEQLRAAARRVDDVRYESQRGRDPLSH